MKARTQAAKLRSKRGRKRLEGQITLREPNGRLSRRKEAEEARTEESARKVKQTATEARARIHAIPEPLCDRPEAGYVLGRLFLFKSITKAQLDAGNRMAEDFARYYGATGIPMPSARAQDLFRVRGMPGPDRGAAARAASKAIMAIEGALGRADQSGRPVTSVTKRVCVLDEAHGIDHPHTLSMLKRGLDALVVHYAGGG